MIDPIMQENSGYRAKNAEIESNGSSIIGAKGV
jgi:hypothetical protein